MGNGPPVGGVCLTAFYGLQNVKMVQDVFHAAIVRQSIEKCLTASFASTPATPVWCKCFSHHLPYDVQHRASMDMLE